MLQLMLHDYKNILTENNLIFNEVYDIKDYELFILDSLLEKKNFVDKVHTEHYISAFTRNPYNSHIINKQKDGFYKPLSVLYGIGKTIDFDYINKTYYIKEEETFVKRPIEDIIKDDILNFHLEYIFYIDISLFTDSEYYQYIQKNSNFPTYLVLDVFDAMKKVLGNAEFQKMKQNIHTICNKKYMHSLNTNIDMYFIKFRYRILDVSCAF